MKEKTKYGKKLDKIISKENIDCDEIKKVELEAYSEAFSLIENACNILMDIGDVYMKARIERIEEQLKKVFSKHKKEVIMKCDKTKEIIAKKFPSQSTVQLKVD